VVAEQKRIDVNNEDQHGAVKRRLAFDDSYCQNIEIELGGQFES
jgi:hypothetical protein